MSLLTYNGITLPYAFATSFYQRPIYDESHTDWYCTEFDIGVQTVLSLPYINIIAPNYTGDPLTSAAELMNYIRIKLSDPRRLLSYKFNDVDLIPAQAGVPGFVDVDNGPKPKECKCTLLTDNTFLVQYRIIARYWEVAVSPAQQNLGLTGTTLTAPNSKGHPVLFNRWTEMVDIDNCQYTTRTREGKYKIRSDNADGDLADDLRSQMAVVGVPKGFNRVSSQYKVTADGLSIQYKVVDREVFKHPPVDAYEASGVYTESSSKMNALRFGNVRIKLKGDKVASQVRLVERAVFIAAAKLRIRGGNPLPSGTGFEFLYKFEVRVGMYENEVEVEMTVMLEPKKSRYKGICGLGNKELTWTPGSDPILDGTPNAGPVYKDRGTCSMLLQAAAYYDPDVLGTTLTGGAVATDDNPTTTSFNSQMSNGLIPGEAGINVEGTGP